MRNLALPGASSSYRVYSSPATGWGAEACAASPAGRPTQQARVRQLATGIERDEGAIVHPPVRMTVGATLSSSYPSMLGVPLTKGMWLNVTTRVPGLSRATSLRIQATCTLSTWPLYQRSA